jgi:hypothetical protein
LHLAAQGLEFGAQLLHLAAQRGLALVGIVSPCEGVATAKRQGEGAVAKHAHGVLT